MADAHECRRRRLVATPTMSVDACSCGALQLHLGALTLRFSPEGLQDVATGLTDALAMYEALTEGHGSLAPRLNKARAQA